MKFSEFGIQLFSGEKSISSKRICGFTGGMVSLFICLGCTFTKVEAPEISDVLFICSTSLLGVEAVTSIFHKSTERKEDKQIDKIN